MQKSKLNERMIFLLANKCQWLAAFRLFYAEFQAALCRQELLVKTKDMTSSSVFTLLNSFVHSDVRPRNLNEPQTGLMIGMETHVDQHLTSSGATYAAVRWQELQFDHLLSFA
jgi:hypothetical protein